MIALGAEGPGHARLEFPVALQVISLAFRSLLFSFMIATFHALLLLLRLPAFVHRAGKEEWKPTRTSEDSLRDE